MELFQNEGGVTTVCKNIVRHPLDSSIAYKNLSGAIEKDPRPVKRPDMYYRDRIKSLVDRIEQVLKGEYSKSGWSKTSAQTRGAHTHFRKDPDAIHKEGLHTQVNTKWLIELSSGWDTNYDIKQLVKAKNELATLLQQTKE